MSLISVIQFIINKRVLLAFLFSLPPSTNHWKSCSLSEQQKIFYKLLRFSRKIKATHSHVRYSLPDTPTTTKRPLFRAEHEKNHNKLLRSRSPIISLQSAGHFSPSSWTSSCSTTATMLHITWKMNENVFFSSTHRHWVSRQAFYRILCLRTADVGSVRMWCERIFIEPLTPVREWDDGKSSASCRGCERSRKDVNARALAWSESTFNPMEHIGNIWWEFIERAMSFSGDSALTL